MIGHSERECFNEIHWLKGCNLKTNLCTQFEGQTLLSTLKLLFLLSQICFYSALIEERRVGGLRCGG